MKKAKDQELADCFRSIWTTALLDIINGSSEKTKQKTIQDIAADVRKTTDLLYDGRPHFYGKNQMNDMFSTMKDFIAANKDQPEKIASGETVLKMLKEVLNNAEVYDDTEKPMTGLDARIDSVLSGR